MLTLVDEKEKVVARLPEPDADWEFLDEEFQQYFETLLIEGIAVLGGEPRIADEDTKDEVIGDTYIVLVPGDEDFDEAFWEEVQLEHSLDYGED